MTYCYLKRFSTWQIDTLKKFSTWEMWIQSVNWTNDVYNLWYFVALNCWKIRFLAIYAVLSKYFCCDLRAFVWRKIEPKIVSAEKKGQIWCMGGPLVGPKYQLFPFFKGSPYCITRCGRDYAFSFSCITGTNTHFCCETKYIVNTCIFRSVLLRFYSDLTRISGPKTAVAPLKIGFPAYKLLQSRIQS